MLSIYYYVLKIWNFIERFHLLDLNNFLYMDGFLEIVKVHYLDALMATFLVLF